MISGRTAIVRILDVMTTSHIKREERNGEKKERRRDQGTDR